MILDLTEQEALNLADWLQQEVESKMLSETSRAIMLNIIKKLDN